MTRWLWLACLWMIGVTEAAAVQVGGMTVTQAFPDSRVARLVEAASRGDAAGVKAQIDAGADVNYVGTQAITPLIWQVYLHNRRGTEIMLEAGANPNYRDPRRNISALYLAIGHRQPELLELLLKHKGNPDLIGENGLPLLHAAVEQRSKRMVELLLDHGADVNILGELGQPAADDAVAYGKFELAAYLLERGFNRNLQHFAEIVEIRQVPEHSEAQRWKDKVIEMLKQRGVKFPAFVRKKPVDSQR